MKPAPFILVSALLFSPGILAAEERVLVLDNPESSYLPVTHADWYRDLTAEQSLEDVLRLPEGEWQASKKDRMNLGVERAAVWLRFRVRNASDTTEWLLVGEDGRLEEFSYAMLDTAGEPVQRGAGGTLRPMSQREIKSRLQIFPLSPRPDEEYIVYLRVRTASRALIAFRLETRPVFYGHEFLDLQINTAYYALLLTVIVANVVLALRTGSTLPWLYIVVISSAGLYQYTLSGYLYALLSPETPFWIWFNRHAGMM